MDIPDFCKYCAPTSFAACVMCFRLYKKSRRKQIKTDR